MTPPSAPGAPGALGRDPRPLVGEPLGLDLLNTIWVDGGVRHDLLADVDGLGVWLTAHGVDAEVPRSPATLAAVREARAAIAAHVDTADAPGARDGVNAILARGALARSLTEDGPVTVPQVDDPAQRPGWTAVESYLRLLERDAGRVRACAHPDCVLHFYDTSRKGNRRWCSMAGCGNRAKAARHYARTRSSEG
ncbi:CGNR zinc finger domain-containing protein [Iamia sp. SCSIO 61187]|uniref:CGNR zinc finger domain-containing protein n=1 Tax=Iamia sp. SCSIO 61187 TaxID=2722752 RepID=UPI001C633C11|nr:CGNR zinc finger domain-containing protein [Iamia sp. SCSIO 61187]QYG94028.1 CGNR zinc finger domain-containing protein [Iamia sp. SCSIO 61187]